VAVKCHAQFSAFDTNTGRVDLLSYSRIAAPNSYVKLWVVKLLLLLSHGQALAEGRFSINRQIEADSIVGEC